MEDRLKDLGAEARSVKELGPGRKLGGRGVRFFHRVGLRWHEAAREVT